jgi:hypothetical protein
MTIVTSTYRYKRPPGKRKPVAIEGPRIVAIDPKTRAAKGSRRPSEGTTAAGQLPRLETAERTQSTMARTAGHHHDPANDDRKSVIVTVRDRKTVQRQREQQQMAKLMQGEGTTALSSRSVVFDRRLGEDITPEEHKRRGDAADALFREIARGRGRDESVRRPPG